MRGGGGGEETEVDQQMVMDGDWGPLSLQRGEQMLRPMGWCHWGSGWVGGRGEGLSALFALRAAVFATTRPQQSLQSHLHKGLEVIASLPSAVLRRGWNRQIPSLETRQPLHLISHHNKTQVIPDWCHLNLAWVCWPTMGSCKCLPPCFLLSSPFWSPFFGCSLGLWGCCEVTQLNQLEIKPKTSIEMNFTESDVSVLPW